MIFSKFFKKKTQTAKQRKFKIGLVLGGGGARGFAHLGVFKAFEEKKFKFDCIVGTSAGSLAGAFFASGMNFEQIMNIIKNIKTRDIKNNKIPFMPSKTEALESLIKDNLGDINIEDLKIPFAAIAVDIKTTDEVVLSKGNLAKAVAGSCAVPGVFTPVEHEDMLLCDGGLQNTLPGNIARIMGCDYVISVDVNSARTYGTNSSKMIDVISASIRTLMKSNVVKGYLSSDIVLQPDTKRFKSTKMDGMDSMIEEGYQSAIERMGEIENIFAKKTKKKKLPKNENWNFSVGQK